MLLSSDSLRPTLAIAGIILLVGCVAVRCLFLIFYHPLSRVPGPFLAKISEYWAYRNHSSGSGPHDLHILHKKLGPIIRIAPNEVSLDGLEAYNAIYGNQNKFLKDPAQYRKQVPPGTVNLFATLGNSEHSFTRRLFAHSFSRTNILGLESVIYGLVDTAVGRIREFIAEDKPVPIYSVTRCFALDATCSFAFGQDIGSLRTPNFHHDAIQAVGEVGDMVLRNWYINLGFLNRFRAKGNVSGLIQMANECLDELENQKLEHVENGTTMFESALSRAESLNFKLDRHRSISEIMGVLFAGTGTTAVTLAFTLQYLMRDPKIYKRAQQEVRSLMSQGSRHPKLVELEQLVYFEACVKEGLRLVCPPRSFSPRVVPPEGREFYGYFLPGGTVVSVANEFMVYNETIFPEPYKYKPERWLVADTSVMTSHLTTFSKGIRNCIGQNLANLEIRLFLSQFLTNFELESLWMSLKYITPYS